ncbi:MAG: AAA family ATPase [Actinomycetota bacterium]|nr:AAA family ATPase [Actinomycetota bacterium]
MRRESPVQDGAFDDRLGQAGDQVTPGARHAEKRSPDDSERLALVLEAFPDAKVGEFEPGEILDILPEIKPIALPPQMVDGLGFALGASVSEPAIWGTEEDAAWAHGEAALIIGPDGVGKTTLCQRLTLSLAGIGPELLGLPVEPAEGRILYVAADRPKQSARSLWRMVQALEDRRDHGRLKEALLVWRGPLPFDVVKTPGELADWALGFGVSHLILDSLGFVAQRLSEDETGSALAQAFMIASTAGLEIMALGHPRKAGADNRKPTSIEDVYGSRWIVAAVGSILSLWGSPGDPVIQLRHLKQPAGEVGPLLVELDHDRGTVAVLEGTDLLGRLRAATNGLTAREAAPFLEGSSERAREVKARRRLDELVRRGLAFRRQGGTIRGNLHEPDRYFATPPDGAREGLR